MVVKIDIDLTGIDDFGPKMNRLDTGLQVEVHEALQGGANLIKADAMFYSPVKTGFLRSTIYAKVKATWHFIVGAWCHYAKYQEFGTRYIRARAFIQRAIKERWSQIRDMVNRAVRLAIWTASK